MALLPRLGRVHSSFRYQGRIAYLVWSMLRESTCFYLKGGSPPEAMADGANDFRTSGPIGCAILVFPSLPANASSRLVHPTPFALHP